MRLWSSEGYGNIHDNDIRGKPGHPGETGQVCVEDICHDSDSFAFLLSGMNFLSLTGRVKGIMKRTMPMTRAMGSPTKRWASRVAYDSAKVEFRASQLWMACELSEQNMRDHGICHKGS